MGFNLKRKMPLEFTTISARDFEGLTNTNYQ